MAYKFSLLLFFFSACLIAAEAQVVFSVGPNSAKPFKGGGGSSENYVGEKDPTKDFPTAYYNLKGALAALAEQKAAALHDDAERLKKAGDPNYALPKWDFLTKSERGKLIQSAILRIDKAARIVNDHLAFLKNNKDPTFESQNSDGIECTVQNAEKLRDEASEILKENHLPSLNPVSGTG